jgi:hypothetical protein
MLGVGSIMLVISSLCSWASARYGNGDFFRVCHIALLFFFYWLAGYIYPIFNTNDYNFNLTFPIATTLFWLLLVLDRNLPVVDPGTMPFPWMLRNLVENLNRVYAGFSTIFDDFFYLFWDQLPYGLGRVFDLFLMIMLPYLCTLLATKGTSARMRRIKQLHQKVFGPSVN